MKLNVTVNGSPPDIWQTLLGTLYARQYKVESQTPYTTLTASRGSKFTSMLLEGTKGGYRDLVVTLAPLSENAIAVEFDFRFPSWAITYSDTKKECEQMVQDFAAGEQPGSPPAPAVAPPATPGGYTPPPVPGGGPICKACGAVVQPNARFCDACGASLAAAAVCGKCGAPLVAGGRFCEKCGARVGP